MGNSSNNSKKSNNLSSLLNSNLVNLDNLQRTGPSNRWSNPQGNSNNTNTNNMNYNFHKKNIY